MAFVLSDSLLAGGGSAIVGLMGGSARMKFAGTGHRVDVSARVRNARCMRGWSRSFTHVCGILDRMANHALAIAGTVSFAGLPSNARMMSP